MKYEIREKSKGLCRVFIFKNETAGSTSAPKPEIAIRQLASWLDIAGTQDIYAQVEHADCNATNACISYVYKPIDARFYILFDCVTLGSVLELHTSFELVNYETKQELKIYCPDSMPTEPQINFALSKVLDCGGDFENIDGNKVARIDCIDTYIGVSVSSFKGELPTLIAKYREVEHSRFE